MKADALVLLGLSNQDWGPCYGDDFTHAEFSEKWRGSVACPSETEIDAARLKVVAEATRVQKVIDVKAQIAILDIKRIRPLAEGDTMYLAKLNEQVVALRAKLQ